MLPELKPCPFCGGQARLSRIISPEGERRGDDPSWDVDCTECWAGGRWSDEQQAIRAWNTRSDARAEAEEGMKRVVEALRPFAEACAHLHPLHPDDGETLDGFKVSDFRRAAEVCAALSQEGGGK